MQSLYAKMPGLGGARYFALEAVLKSFKGQLNHGNRWGQKVLGKRRVCPKNVVFVQKMLFNRWRQPALRQRCQR
jgi:hypothetical protein